MNLKIWGRHYCDEQNCDEKASMKLHVFVATTQGLVAIQNITAIDDAEISSIVSINGTSTTANISNAYHNFVKNGAGIIQHDFGACSYRLNINKRIDQGNSWQLAFYLAHAAKNEGILGDGQVAAGDKVICATGEINTSSRDIQCISDLNLKQKLAAKQIKAWHKNKINVSFLVPQANAQDIDKKLPLNIKLVSNLAQAIAYMPLTSQTELRKKTPLTGKIHSCATAAKYWFSKVVKNNLVTISVLSLFILAGIGNYWLADDDIISEKTVENSLAHTNNNNQIWQVILLTEPDYQVNSTLQPAYSIIDKTITEQLIADGFDVADKTLLFNTNQISEQAIYQLENDAVNLAIRFNLTVNRLTVNSLANKGSTKNSVPETWHYELSAYLIDLETKKKIETHTEYGEFSNNASHCDDACFSQWHAINARKLAQDMGAILVMKLNNLPRKYQFELTFQDFPLKELTLLNNKLTRLNGFLSSKLLQEFTSNSLMLRRTSSRKYSYRTYLPVAELDFELRKTFEQLALSVTSIKGNDKSLTFIRYNSPYSFYLYIGLAVLLALLGMFVVAQRKGIFSFAGHNKANNLTANLSISHSIDNHTVVESQNVPIKGAVQGLGKLANYYIFTETPVELGRMAKDDTTPAFSIGYQHLSKHGKQCQFSYEKNDFYIKDQGSTNGSILNGTQLTANEKVAISKTSQLILGGVNKADIPLCQLNITLAKKHDTKQPTALIMQLNSTSPQFFNLDSALHHWPSINKDLTSHWILLMQEVALGIIDGQFVLGNDDSETIAYLLYQDGFYIRPGNSAVENKQIMINEKTIVEKTAITENAVVSINGYEFSLQSTVK